MKSAPEERDWPFPELRLEKERLNHADLMIIFVHTWLTVEGCQRIYTELNRASWLKKLLLLRRYFRHNRMLKREDSTQQQATNQRFLQMMGTLASALHPGQPHS